ncbi:MAG: hypothetical protein AMXMBFR20_11040 [Planctomycetia bacterium]
MAKNPNRLTRNRSQEILLRLNCDYLLPDFMEAVAYNSLPRRLRINSKLGPRTAKSGLIDVSDAELQEARREFWLGVWRVSVPPRCSSPSFADLSAYIRTKRPELTEKDVMAAAAQAIDSGLVRPLNLDRWEWNEQRFGLVPKRIDYRHRGPDWYHPSLRFSLTTKGRKHAKEYALNLLGGTAKKKKAKVAKMPSQAAIKCYQAWIVKGCPNQKELADFLSNQLGRPISQGSVSRMMSSVSNFMAAGGVLPPVLDKSRSGRTRPFDPKLADMGPRQDHRTARQRGRRDLADEYDD